MTATELQTVLIGALMGLLSSTGFLLALFVGFVFFAGLTKFRSRKGAMVVRSLSESMGGKVKYFAPDIPTGPADQLRTPELLEHSRPGH